MFNKLVPVNKDLQPDGYPHDAKGCVQLVERSVEHLPAPLDESMRWEIGRVLDRAADSIWQSSELEQDAREAALGLVVSLNNGMVKQAEMHLKQLELACGRNAAETTVRALHRTDIKAKPFAICEEAVDSFEIAGHGYDWQIDSLDISSELIPAVYLARINFIRSYGIEPDAFFVGVPYSVEKPPVSTVLGRELQAMSHRVKTVAAGLGNFLSKSAAIVKDMKRSRDLEHQAPRVNWEMKKLPDPVLLIGFGHNPCVLVEVSRWE